MARTVPVESTRSPGDGLTAAYLNSQTRDAINFLLTPPLARIRQNTAQSIANNTWTAITFDLTDWDSDSGHSNVTNNSRYTCQVAGYYHVFGTVAYGTNTVPLANIGINGTRNPGSGNVGSGSTTINGTSFVDDVVHLVVNDYVELFTLQNSGGAINTSVAGDFRSVLNVKWIYSG